MAYVSLYRKYRPQTFGELVGQDHVIRSLTNALTEDRIHHAYLFTGPRGTGKTSTARILAKSINCVNGPTPTPCNECDQCVAITNGTSLDVIELDMASHGGVDDARELRERASFAPASARRKVYILDEVHMASTGAFNALLKLIEDPPQHVVFAMATTDPQKVIPTVMSRVQRLDLRRVGATEAAARVRDLVEREGGTIDEAAVAAIVRAGDGSLRDTESVLEQVLTYSGGHATGAVVADVLGQTPFESTAAAVEAVAAGDLAGAFVVVQTLLDAGGDLRQFALDLVGHVRDLLVLVVAPGRDDLVDVTDERREALTTQAAGLDRGLLTAALDELAKAIDDMRHGPARLAVELALARLVVRSDGDAGSGTSEAEPADREAAGPASDESSDSVDAGSEDAATGGHEALSRRANARAVRAARDGVPVAPDDRPRGPEAVVDLPPSRDESADLDTIRTEWGGVLEMLRADSPRRHAVFEPADLVSLRNGVLTLSYGPRYRSFHAAEAAKSDFSKALGATIERACGIKLRVEVVLEGEQRRPRPTSAQDDESDDESDVESDVESTMRSSSPQRTEAVTSTDNVAAYEPPAETAMASDAMDRAGATLFRHLGAREVDRDDV